MNTVPLYTFTQHNYVYYVNCKKSFRTKFSVLYFLFLRDDEFYNVDKG